MCVNPRLACIEMNSIYYDLLKLNKNQLIQDVYRSALLLTVFFEALNYSGYKIPWL